MFKQTLRDRIFAALDKLHGIGSLKYYPTSVDEETGEVMFVCHFCGEIGHFPDGNDGISHTPECAIALAYRIPKEGNLNFFDQLAYLSVLHQIASLERYPQRWREGYADWDSCCPFCLCWMKVTKETHQDGRGITTTYTMPHTEGCIVTLAKTEIEQQGGRA